MRVRPASLRDAVSAAFAARGVEPSKADAVSEVLIEAEAEGLAGHGLARVAQYMTQLELGGVRADAEIEVSRTGPATAVVDGGGGFGAPAGLAAVQVATELAIETGSGVVVVRAAGHAGPLSAYVRRLAERELLAFCVANAPPALAPWGGGHAILGTNPVAFAAPTVERPIVVDLSLSVVARAKILSAARRNEKIPQDWAVDAEGNPTADPNAALEGALLPVGGAKGYALAIMVEVLSGALGGALSPDLPMPWVDPEKPSHPGLFMHALDPTRFGPTAAYEARVKALSDLVEEAGGRLPGRRRVESSRRAEDEGLEIDSDLASQLRGAGVRLTSEEGPA
jgi:(2R)-3-sulfolactate dehydrogenase (NADP+)